MGQGVLVGLQVPFFLVDHWALGVQEILVGPHLHFHPKETKGTQITKADTFNRTAVLLLTQQCIWGEINTVYSRESRPVTV